MFLRGIGFLKRVQAIHLFFFLVRAFDAASLCACFLEGCELAFPLTTAAEVRRTASTIAMVLCGLFGGGFEEGAASVWFWFGLGLVWFRFDWLELS